MSIAMVHGIFCGNFGNMEETRALAQGAMAALFGVEGAVAGSIRTPTLIVKDGANLRLDDSRPG